MEQQVEKDSLLTGTSKLGLRGIKSFLLTIFIFGFTNITILIISAYLLHTLSKYGIALAILFIIGILLTIAGLNFTLKYVIIEGLQFAYKQLDAFFKKLCFLIVNKITSTASGVGHLNNQHIEKAFNIGDLFHEIYGRKIPRLIQKAVRLVLKRIPFADILTDMKDVLKTRDSQEASEILYQRVDSYIKDNVFASNTMKCLYWLVSLNIILQGIIVFIFYYYHQEILSYFSF